MLRDRQHGPVIELNRISVKKSSQKAPPPTSAAAGATPGTSAGPSGTGNGCKPVFQQMVVKMHLLGQEALLLPHRVWKVKFIGERYKNYRLFFDKKKCISIFYFDFYFYSVDNCGRGYSESIAEMCDELQANNGGLLGKFKDNFY